MYNTPMPCLPRHFFNQDAVITARSLLGMLLVRELDGHRLSGVIVETEAYEGEEDLACHARSGKTARNAVMYGPAGMAYIYFTYGMHWCLNAVTGKEGHPAAVLIRSIVPVEGREIIALNRSGQPERIWTDGPAKLCKGLSINGEMNGTDLCSGTSLLRIETGNPVEDDRVKQSPRIGIQNTPEPWRSLEWRFRVVETDRIAHG